jgi:hypothetical protein
VKWPLACKVAARCAPAVPWVFIFSLEFVSLSDRRAASALGKPKRKLEGIVIYVESSKVRRIEDGEFVVLLLSGRIDGEHLLELQRIFVSEDGNLNLILDMKEVNLVDQEVVRFLLSCEAGGIRLRNCPAYIREWIRRGETRKGI